MKQNKLMFLMAGFLAGMMYVVACGTTGQSIAAAIGNAIDVVFDNTTSGLTATTVQGAIDEVNTKLTSTALPKVVDASGNVLGILLGTNRTGDDELDAYNSETNGILSIQTDGSVPGWGLYYTSADCTGQAYVAAPHLIVMAGDDHLYKGDPQTGSSITYNSEQFSTGICNSSMSATVTLYQAVDVTTAFPATIIGPIQIVSS